MHAQSVPATLVHVTTVPSTLNFFRGQAAFMRAHGIETHAISSPGEDLDRFGHEEQVRVYAVPMERRITPLRDLRALARLWRHLRRLRPDIVHAATPKAGLLAMISAWCAGVPVRIYHVLGLPMETAGGHKRRLLWWTERLACRLSTQVLCVSHSLREVMIEEGLCAAPRITVLLDGSVSGVDADNRFNPALVGEQSRSAIRRRHGIPPDALVLGYVGRIVGDKGIRELAQAWSTLRAQHPAAHLLMVGPFESQDPIPEATERLLRDDPRVHLRGMDWDTPPLLAVMDVLVLPTYREGMGIILLEAAAMCLPVVASRVTGCVDAVDDGVTGTLVPARDADALSKAVSGYLRDPALRKKHGRAGRDRVLRRFRPAMVQEALLREYAALLDTHGVSRSVFAREVITSNAG